MGGERAKGKIQRNNYHHGSCGPSLTGKMSSVCLRSSCTGPWECPGGPKLGVSNERFSAKVKLRCKLDIHTALLLPPVYLRRRVGLHCFQGVTKDFECFKFSTVPRSPAGSKISRNRFFSYFSVFFSSIKAEWLGLYPKSYRPIFASHSNRGEKPAIGQFLRGSLP